MSEFEDAIMSEALPCNSVVACNRLIEILREKRTNSVQSASNDWRVRAIVWFLMVQLTGEQVGTVDMHELWIETEEMRR